MFSAKILLAKLKRNRLNPSQQLKLKLYHVIAADRRQKILADVANHA